MRTLVKLLPAAIFGQKQPCDLDVSLTLKPQFLSQKRDHFGRGAVTRAKCVIHKTAQIMMKDT
jgi:hypothetical protein